MHVCIHTVHGIHTHISKYMYSLCEQVYLPLHAYLHTVVIHTYMHHGQCLNASVCREPLMSELMKETDDIAAKRKAFKEMKELLMKAVDIVNEVMYVCMYVCMYL
jgi:hypothetical protein